MTSQSISTPSKDAPSGPERYPDEVSRAHAELRRLILRGDLRAGESLSQVDLAIRIGVTRGPLREALRLLQREGFVEQEAQHRARVASFSPEDLDELYAMRISLEGLAVALAVPQMTADQLDRLTTLLAEMDAAQAADDVGQWERPHHEFHSVLIHPSGPRIERELELLADHATRYRLAELAPNKREWEPGAGDHQILAAAARDGDVDAAAEALARHFGRTALVALSLAAPTYEPRRVRRALSQIVRQPAPHPAILTTPPIRTPATTRASAPSVDTSP